MQHFGGFGHWGRSADEVCYPPIDHVTALTSGGF
jgi:hypothetical protein